MKFFVLLAVAGIVGIAAGPANAADWWLVAGSPGQRSAVFADVGSLVRQDDAVNMRVLRIERSGRSEESVEHVSCTSQTELPADEALRRFACSSERDRDNYGLILAGMSSQQAARMMFDTNTQRDRQLRADPER